MSIAIGTADSMMDDIAEDIDDSAIEKQTAASHGHPNTR